MDGLWKLKSPILLIEIMLTQHSYWQTLTSSFFRLVLNMRLINLHLSLSLPIFFSSWDSFGGPHSGWLHNRSSIAWVKILSRQFLVLVLIAESIIFATSNQKALHQWDLHTKGNWKYVYASFPIIILEQYTKPKIMKLAILDFHQIVEQVHACAHWCTSVVKTKLWLWSSSWDCNLFSFGVRDDP